MPTIILPIDPESPAPESIQPAAEALLRGELVAFPTETVYGLGANALDEEAVARIFSAKGRPASDPLIVHLASSDDIPLVALDFPPLARTLADSFWPGPLTILLPRRADLPLNVTAGSALVAVRVPSHPAAHMLLELAGIPVAAPSANRFAHTSPTSAAHVLSDLEGRIEWILDGGSTPIGVESTVIDPVAQPPVILRPGGVPRDAIESRIGPVRYPSINERRLDSPGRQDRHYAPHTRLILLTGVEPAEIAAAFLSVLGKMAEGEKVGLLAADEILTLVAMRNPPVVIYNLGSFFSERTVARRLFSGLRTLEEADVTIIFSHRLPKTGLGEAINDRLNRASHSS